MDLENEIRKLAYELYEKSGRIQGRNLDNWLKAEKIVMERYPSKKKKSASPQEETKKTAKGTSKKKI